MNKPVIGILPTSDYMMYNDTFKDTYRFGNNYVKKIVENGGIPLLIPYCDDEVILDTLKMCDGLLLPGGNRMLESNFKVLDYFYNKKKPILGICLGMQTIAVYSVNKNLQKRKRILKEIDTGVNHWPQEILRDNNECLAHKDIVKKDSVLGKIIGKEEVMVNSVHHYTVTEVGADLVVSIMSEDGLIEGIESKNSEQFIVGVQFHPEVLPQFNNIFKVFIDKCLENK